MKKILCAITSAMKSDIKEWEKLNDHKSFDHYHCAIGDDLLCVINGSIYCDSSGKWDYENVKKIISNIAENKPLGILFHDMRPNENSSLRNKLEGLNIIGMESFSTAGRGKEIYQRYVIPFTEARNTNEKINKYSLLFDKIEKKSPEDKVNKAIVLRSQLLTPLVALDWIEQMDAIRDNPEIKELKQSIIEKYSENINDEFKIKWDLSFPKINIPEQFLNISEQTVEIHKPLETFASTIEAHIEQMQQ